MPTIYTQKFGRPVTFVVALAQGVPNQALGRVAPAQIQNIQNTLELNWTLAPAGIMYKIEIVPRDPEQQPMAQADIAAAVGGERANSLSYATLVTTTAQLTPIMSPGRAAAFAQNIRANPGGLGFDSP